MSGKKKKDYKAVIREIIKIIPGQPSVKKVTVDFERAIWSAFQTVLLEVRIMGCAFNWTQALWRKVSVGKLLKALKLFLVDLNTPCRVYFNSLAELLSNSLLLDSLLLGSLLSDSSLSQSHSKL